MSKAQEPETTLFSFWNPFKNMFAKGSNISPKLLTMSNTFGTTLAERLKNLKPKDMEDLFSLAWMRLVDSLCETHTDIKSFINKLELPTCDWDNKWFHVYFNLTIKIPQICYAFRSELSRLTHSHLLFRYHLFMLELEVKRATQSSKPHTALTSLRQHLSLKSPKLDNCCNILHTLTKNLTLPMPKIKNSSKEKALMQALYGVQYHTLLVSNILDAWLTGPSENLIDLHVPEMFLCGQSLSKR